MSTKRTMLEIIAPSVDEAIAQGLADLGLERDAVEIETLDEGSRGLFGLGTRQARIRITVKDVATEAKAVHELPDEEDDEPVEAVAEAAPSKPVSTRYEEVQQEVTLDICRDTVAELLERIGIDCEVTAQFGDVDDVSGIEPVMVDVEGDRFKHPDRQALGDTQCAAVHRPPDREQRIRPQRHPGHRC